MLHIITMRFVALFVFSLFNFTSNSSDDTVSRIIARLVYNKLETMRFCPNVGSSFLNGWGISRSTSERLILSLRPAECTLTRPQLAILSTGYQSAPSATKSEDWGTSCHTLRYCIQYSTCTNNINIWSAEKQHSTLLPSTILRSNASNCWISRDTSHALSIAVKAFGYVSVKQRFCCIAQSGVFTVERLPLPQPVGLRPTHLVQHGVSSSRFKEIQVIVSTRKNWSQEEATILRHAKKHP
jgi:hypothetical protein